jgi:hypothetical protein
MRGLPEHLQLKGRESMYAVITDRTPNRCTIASIEYSESDATEAAERLDTGVNGMPAEVMRVAPGDPGNLEPGDRAWHDGEMCWSEAGCV